MGVATEFTISSLRTLSTPSIPRIQRSLHSTSATSACLVQCDVCAVHAILDEATMPATHYEKFLEALVQEEPEMTVRRLHGRGSDVRGSGSMGSSEECVFFAMLKCSPSCHGQ